MIVRFASGVIEALREAARTAHPDECCGLVTGKPGLIEAVVPARNVSPHPATSFEIDPGTLMRTHREVRDRQRQVIGHYHSHPNGSAQPSRRDAARATHNGQLWLIIAAGGVTAWRAVAQRETDDAADAGDGCVHGRFLPVRLLAV
jgi:proteasome lid subunit RPN8/RPN11